MRARDCEGIYRPRLSARCLPQRQKAMCHAAADVVSNNITFGVDARDSSGCRAREIDQREGAIAKHAATHDAARKIGADEIALWVDT